MKIYTRGGDKGSTGLFGGKRVRKSVARVEAYGTVDELNSSLGVAAAFLKDADLQAIIQRLQGELLHLGADLATPPEASAAASHIARISDEDVRRLEATIDQLENELPPLRTFILPGGDPGAAHLHLARSISRRAERRAVAALDSGEAISGAVLKYLNRISDLLFVMARVANKRAERQEAAWKPDASR